jgi:gamma-glutamyl phosphate reductase
MINVNKLSSSEITALNRIREPGINQVLKVLQDELESTKQKLVYANEMDVIHRMQGRAEALEDLLKAVDESQKVVKAR